MNGDSGCVHGSSLQEDSQPKSDDYTAFVPRDLTEFHNVSYLYTVTGKKRPP